MATNLRGLHKDFIIPAQLSTTVCESQECILRKSSKDLMLSPGRPISLGGSFLWEASMTFLCMVIHLFKTVKALVVNSFFFFYKEGNFM